MKKIKTRQELEVENYILTLKNEKLQEEIEKYDKSLWEHKYYLNELEGELFMLKLQNNHFNVRDINTCELISKIDKNNNSKLNCLQFALRFWNENNDYKLFYNSDHVINLEIKNENTNLLNYLPIEGFGYNNIYNAFLETLTDEDIKLLKKYFNII